MDEPKLIKFIDWLPELLPNEKYYVSLQARKKYLPELVLADKTQVKRFVSDKKRLLEKIRQLECPIGSYTTKEGKTIPDDGLVLYITINPRNMLKATFSSAKAMLDLIEKGGLHKEYDVNPHSEVLSQIHKAKSRTIFVHFDIDRTTGSPNDKNSTKSNLTTKQIYEKTIQVVGEKAVTIIETKNGAHVLINVFLANHHIQWYKKSKNWHPIIVKELKCDQVGDLMVPVIGCNQGGFIPHFYKYE